MAHVKVKKPDLRNLDDHVTPVVFIGYEEGAKVWHFYDPASR
jgi:hypothetical protein